MKHLTIRNVPLEIANALEKERTLTRGSLNQTVIDLLARALGLGGGKPTSNGLAKLAGTWSEEDLRRFEAAMSAMEQVDPELWA